MQRGFRGASDVGRRCSPPRAFQLAIGPRDEVLPVGAICVPAVVLAPRELTLEHADITAGILSFV